MKRESSNLEQRRSGASSSNLHGFPWHYIQMLVICEVMVKPGRVALGLLERVLGPAGVADEEQFLVSVAARERDVEFPGNKPLTLDIVI